MAEIQRWGETFQVADKVALMPLMRFAQVAQAGVDSNEMAGLAALGDLLDKCIAPSDLAKFNRVATANDADGDDLMEVVKEVFQIITERPTSRPSDSSDGSSTTSESSAVVYSSPVTRLEKQGRPDLALLTRRAQTHLASA